MKVRFLRCPLKRTPLRRKSKSETRKIQDALWEECKRIIRARYGNVCYTCGVTGLEGAGWHTGHFIPDASGGALLRYDLRNLRPQCYHCNINLGGNGALFYRRMVEREGQAYVDELFILKQKQLQDVHPFEKDKDHYSHLLEEYRHIEK